jgi:hypothetical protein
MWQASVLNPQGNPRALEEISLANRSACRPTQFQLQGNSGRTKKDLLAETSLEPRHLAIGLRRPTDRASFSIGRDLAGSHRFRMDSLRGD